MKKSCWYNNLNVIDLIADPIPIWMSQDLHSFVKKNCAHLRVLRLHIGDDRDDQVLVVFRKFDPHITIRDRCWPAQSHAQSSRKTLHKGLACQEGKRKHRREKRLGHTGLIRYMHTMSVFWFLDLAVKMTLSHVLNADPIEKLL